MGNISKRVSWELVKKTFFPLAVSKKLVEVLSIGIRRSKFLSENKKEVIIMPNIDLSKSKIINYTYAQEA